MRTEIVEQTLARIVTKSSASVTHFVDFLKRWGFYTSMPSLLLLPPSLPSTSVASADELSPHPNSLLHRIVALGPHLFVDLIPKVKDAFDYLSFLSPPVAHGLLQVGGASGLARLAFALDRIRGLLNPPPRPTLTPTAVCNDFHRLSCH